MLYPTINELTKGQYNRYELSLATAKCARIVTDEYVKQREDAEHANANGKDSDHPTNTMIDKELRDDIGMPFPSHGDLTSWAKQGVLLSMHNDWEVSLLNRLLIRRHARQECSMRVITLVAFPLVRMCLKR